MTTTTTTKPTTTSRTALRVLQQRVRARAAAMEASHGAWPCRAGCDGCCHRLGAVPSFTDAEAERLREAYGALPAASRAAIRRRVERLRPDPHGRFVCPLLDPERGRCSVYEARPIACRTYGFYSGRQGDYWCDRVTAHIGARRDTLVAGNQLAIDGELDARLGPAVDLVTLMRDCLER